MRILGTGKLLSSFSFSLLLLLLLLLLFIILVHLVESVHFSFTLIVLKSNVEKESLPLM